MSLQLHALDFQQYILHPSGLRDYNIFLTALIHTKLLAAVNPLTSVSHWSGFKVKLTFHGTQLFGSSLFAGQILVYAYKLIVLVVECIWYNLGHV